MTVPKGDPGSLPLASVLAVWDDVVDRWDLDEVERSYLLGGTSAGAVTEIATYRTVDCEVRMRLLVSLAPILDQVHGDAERTRSWLRASNRHLGGSAPIDVMAASTAWTRWLVDHVGLTT